MCERLEMRIEDALVIAERYGAIDGSHHKQWVIDQMVRALLGGEYAYEDWVSNYCNGDRGSSTYEWVRGIAP